MGLRPWLLGVTWRHRSRDHSTRGGRLPMGGPLWPCVYLTPTDAQTLRWFYKYSVHWYAFHLTDKNLFSVESPRDIIIGGSRSWSWGPKARAESRRQRRKEGWGVERGCFPFDRGRGMGRGQCLFPRIFFWNFGVKMAYFCGLLVLNFVFFLWPKQYRNTPGIQWLPWRLTCMQ